MKQESDIADGQVHSQHYLKTVAEFGDVHSVHAVKDIHSARGIKLLSAGAEFNSAICERLLNHKLIPRLDECLATDTSVNNQVLVADASILLTTDLRLMKMLTVVNGEREFNEVLANISLNPGLTFKLSVMRTQRPDLYQHSVFVSLVTIYIGIQAGLRGRRLIDLATAALLHDIGILHVDPAYLERGHPMTVLERRHLYAHPVTAWMILREYQELSAEVAEAVLQHHERLDGSGYPQGLLNDEIGQFGQIISVAEIVASRYGKESSKFDALRMETILKLNSKRYGRPLVGYLRVFYDEVPDVPPSSDEDRQAIRRSLFSIAAVLAGWESIREQCPQGSLNSFVDERVQGLKMELLDAGLNPYAVEKNMLGMEDNPRATAEASILMDEATWQVRAILHEIRRRWPGVDAVEKNEMYRPVHEWMRDVESLLG